MLSEVGWLRRAKRRCRPSWVLLSTAEPGSGVDSTVLPLAASPGDVCHPILQGVTGGRGWRQSPAALSSVPFPSPPAKHVQGCKGHVWQRRQG